MRHRAVVDSPHGLGLHGHVGWLFDDDDEFVAAAVEFLDEGAALGQRLFYVADRPSGDLTAELAPLVGRDRLLASGGLVVVCLSDPQAPAMAMTPEQRDATYRAVVDGALGSGYIGVRVAIDTTATAVDPRGRVEQARWERLGDRLICERPLSALCGIHRRVLGDAGAAELACLHPVLNAPAHLVPFSAFAEGDGIALSGEADAQSADLLVRALAASPPAPCTVTVDVSRLGFIDGAAFAAVQSYADAMGAAGGELVLAGARPIVRRMAEILGRSRWLTFAPDDPAAALGGVA